MKSLLKKALSSQSKMATLAIVLFCLNSLIPALSALPLCTDSRAPTAAKTPLKFCPYNGTICCDAKQDLSLSRQFQQMNISDPGCASLIKSILCASCDPFSADLFQTEAQPRTVPVLCNSTANSSQSVGATNSFCSNVWNICKNVSIRSSPFAPLLQGRAGTPINSSSAELTELWQSQDDFCKAFGGSSGGRSICFSGGPVSLNDTQSPTPPSGLCLERIGNGSYLNMAAHPDGSSRVFLANQAGKIWLATIPAQGSGGLMGLDESSPFLDLTDTVHFDRELGMMGMAFHPNFVKNGRFFVSFNCDKTEWASCSGRCSCNSDVGCDPSKLGTDNGAQPCQFQSVIAEFTANGTSSTPSSATSANPSEVRRIFTMGLPFTSHHGGQILFGPADGYLYFMMGDGGNSGDPYNFAQNKKSLLGKIMRLDVDNTPSSTQVTNLGLWGNYSIPRDNPSSSDRELQPEIWALGFRNPWRCSFDSERPSYFFCADVGQEQYEEVDLVSKGGNYGWRVYEGPILSTPPKTAVANTSPDSIDAIFPVMGYTHSIINTKEGSASITGGYIYHSSADPCMFGRFLFADLYASAIWTGVESPENSGKFNQTQISFGCAKDSPLSCNLVPGSALPSLGYIFSFGEDNNKDVYILASSGVYRIVLPSRCNYACLKENVPAAVIPSPASTPSSTSGCTSTNLSKKWELLVLSFLIVMNFCF